MCRGAVLKRLWMKNKYVHDERIMKISIKYLSQTDMQKYLFEYVGELGFK